MTDISTPPAGTHKPSLIDRLFAPANRLTWIAAVVLVAVLSVWIAFTPSGILGKADAVGYAVCHRIAVRSFLFPNARPLPLCARCTGTFLGVLIGLLGPGLIFKHRRAGGFPPMAILAVMIGVSAIWAFDGANSFAHLVPIKGIPLLYEPTNFLRVTTGMFHGITMGGLVLPIFNATVWADADPEPVIANWKELGLYYLIGAVLIAMVYSQLGVFLYPLALLSATGTVAIITTITTVIVTTLIGRYNTAHTPAEALPLLMLGMAAAFVMVGGIDALRYAAFGTWNGFNISDFQSFLGATFLL